MRSEISKVMSIVLLLVAYSISASASNDTMLSWPARGYDSPVAPDTIYQDDFNRPDATGDAWGAPVIGGAYYYLNPDNADFAISDSTGFLDDNTNVGDPQAVSDIGLIVGDFTLEFSWAYEGGRGSGIRLYDGATLVYALKQEGYDETLSFYNGTAWETVASRIIDEWHEYRVDIVDDTAKVYIDGALQLTTAVTLSSFDQIHYWAEGNPDGLGTSDSWFEDVILVEGFNEGWYSDDFNRPDATGDAWGAPVIGGAYYYLNPDNADFAISDSTGFLDDNTNVGDPQAVSDIGLIVGDFTLEFSWAYEGGRGSGIRLYDGATLVYALKQEGYDETLSFYNGTAWETVASRIIDEWHEYRVDVTGSTAKVYIDGDLKLTTTITSNSFDQIHYWAEGNPDGLGTSDSWFDDVSIAPYTGVQVPPVEELWQVLVRPCMNPAYGTVEISYRVPLEGRVQLAVYNVSGRLIEMLADGYRATGSYSQVITDLQPGVYICHLLCSNDISSSAKFVVID
jgi:hypothetical protein